MDRAGRPAVCLMLGAATTVAVAWVLAVRVVVPVQGGAYARTGGVYRDRNANTYSCQVKQRPGLTAVVWEPKILEFEPGVPGVGMMSSYERLLGSRPDAIDSGAIPAWARGARPVPPPAGAACAASARGWPMRALWYLGTFQGRRRTVWGGLELPGTLQWIGPGQVLPCRPIAEGLVVNSVFYGGLWYGLLSFPGALRRASRWRGGRCTWCGYDLAHGAADRCPECGRESQVSLFCRGWRKPCPSPWSAPASWDGRTPTPG